MAEPSVSCLCVTRGRPERLRQAISHFRKQTYPNREMVVVVDLRGGCDAEYRAIYHELCDSNDPITMTVGVAAKNLAAFRNFSVELAQGEILATWDDDDHYHPERLARQVEHLKKSGVRTNYLQHGALWFEAPRQLYLINYDIVGLAGSMVAWRKNFPLYPEKEVRPGMGERNADAKLQKDFSAASQTSLLPGCPWLYTRVFHGGNMWERESFIKMVRDIGWTTNWIRSVQHELVPELVKYFPGKLPDVIFDNDDNTIEL